MKAWVLMTAVLAATHGGQPSPFWEILKTKPLTRREHHRQLDAEARYAQASVYFGCYRLELPTQLRVTSEPSLDAYLSRSPGQLPRYFAAFFDPAPPAFDSVWTTRDPGVEFSWSTGLGGLHVSVARSGSGYSASGAHLSDVVTFQPLPEYPIKVTKIACTPNLIAARAVHIRHRKIAIWAMRANLEARKSEREKHGESAASLLVRSELEFLTNVTLLSLEQIESIAREVDQSDWPERGACDGSFKGRFFSAPLELELRPEPRAGAVSSEMCHADSRVFEVVVTPAGKVREARVSSVDRMTRKSSLPQEQLLEVDRALHRSRWYPALRCGRPVEATTWVTLVRRAPCEQR